MLNVFSELPHSGMFELTVKHLDRARIDFHALLLNPPTPEMPPLERAFREAQIPTSTWAFRGQRDYLRTLLRLTRHLRSVRYDIVHTHLRWAYYAGLPAAYLARVPVRVLTRWHAAEHHREHPRAVKFDKAASALATHLIAPGSVAERILIEWEGVPPAKVTRLAPPVDIDAFRYASRDDVAALRARYNPDRRAPVIGVIARWVEWKGVQFIIPAFRDLLDRYPDALLLLFNASGPFADPIRRALAEIPDRNYRVVAFEPMVAPLFQIFDLFVHVPTHTFAENTGGVYSEALAAGVPSIFTLSGHAIDLVQHMKQAYVVPFCDSSAILAGMRAILDDPNLARRFREVSPAAVPNEFRPDVHARALESLYLRFCEERGKSTGFAF